MKIQTDDIPHSNLNKKKITKNGTTQDIINSVLRMDKKTGSEFCQFSSQFSDGLQGLKRLWNFTRYSITYKADKDHQIIKAPAALYKISKGDCKSKTLFINAVLRCLGIPYIIRFTNYKPRQREVKHVYTVAIIDGKEVPIDSVYHLFGVEKPYNLKIDYPMAEITEITGLDFEQVNRKLNPVQKERLQALKTQQTIQEACSLYSGENVKRLEEIRQKKEYVKEPEPITFNRVTEATARLQIAKRQIDILQVMQPEKKELCIIAERIINKALKGDYSLTGNIPGELKNLCVLIKQAAGLQMRADSFGLQAKITNARLQNVKGDQIACKTKQRIGQNFPARVCLFNNFWFLQGYQPTNIDQTNATYTPVLDNVYSPITHASNNPNASWGVCDISDLSQIMNMPLLGSHGLQPDNGMKTGDVTKFFYGKDSDYGTYYSEVGNHLESVLQQVNGNLIHGLDDIFGNVRTGTWSAYINTQNDFDALVDIMKAESGVMSNFVNDIFRADQTSINGTLGSGMFYHFADSINYSSQAVNPNDLPGSVITKKAFQNSFMDSCNIFAGVSKANLSGLARNGVLFDSGKQPEPTLEYLYSIYRTGNIPGGQGISDGGISAIIGAIAAAIVSIVGAVAAAANEASQAESQAPLIDSSLSDTANFRPLTPSTMADSNDWLPTFGGAGGGGTGGGGGNGSGSNTGFLIGAAALGIGVAALNGKNKKTK